MAEEPGLIRVRHRLDQFCRNVWLDTRGMGSSDRHLDVAHATSEGVRNAQISAVADAVGSDRFALLACGVTGPVGIRYATAHPERISALILYHSFASMVRDDTCPWGWPKRFIEERLPAWTAETWGTGQHTGPAPSRKDDARLWEWVARSQRLWSSPSVAGEWNRAGFLYDVRDRLDAVRAPTLVLRRRDVVWPIEASQDLAEDRK